MISFCLAIPRELDLPSVYLFISLLVIIFLNLNNLNCRERFLELVYSDF